MTYFTQKGYHNSIPNDAELQASKLPEARDRLSAAVHRSHGARKDRERAEKDTRLRSLPEVHEETCDGRLPEVWGTGCQENIKWRRLDQC